MTTLEDYIRQVVPNPVFSDYMTFASVADNVAMTQTVDVDFTQVGAKLVILRSVVLYNANGPTNPVTLVDHFNNVLMQYDVVNASTMNGMYGFDYVWRSMRFKLVQSFPGSGKVYGGFTAQVQYVYDQESKVLKK